MDTPHAKTQSPFGPFRRDHVHVLATLVEIEAAADPAWEVDEAELSHHLDRLGLQFDTHMAAEEAVLYPRLARALPTAEASLRPLHEEHVDLRAMLAELRLTLLRPHSRSRDVQIAVQARDLVDLLRAHIRKEESVVFDVSERILLPSELHGLSQELSSFFPAPERLAKAREKGNQTS